MKAQNLSICVPYNGCDKNCPYCISKMTGYTEGQHGQLMDRNVNKVRQLAKACQVSSVLITGKGEPMLSRPYVESMIQAFRDFPVELQTNGKLLLQDVKGHGIVLNSLQERGLDTLALSVDCFADIAAHKPLFSAAQDLGLTNRITVNLLDTTLQHSFADYVSACKHNNIQQLSFRSITVPNYVQFEVGSKAALTVDWINKNVDKNSEALFLNLMRDSLSSKGKVLRQLPYGATLFDYEGLSVTYFDYCIQDKSGEDDIRSLIFMDDGHVYTNWASTASRLF